MINSQIKKRGLLLVLSSPSGTGKTAIAHKILENDKNFFLSVSATTRKPRPGEVDGKDYFFVGYEKFQEMVKNGEFLEHAEFCGNCYGTPKKPIEIALAAGKDVLFDIEWQGARQLAEKARDDLVSISILPPSLEELKNRLLNRQQDSIEVIENRMKTASDEASHYNEYDYVIINEDLEESIEAVRSILISERLKKNRQLGLKDFVENKLKGIKK
ncbi:MAG: guanylate kinase [Alphaproteobacteria bacterium]|nr:guanylate kinase [Alphaproteobacteria bacterium]